MERWELSYSGCPKVCLKCFERGHIKKDCKSERPTVSQIIKGEVTWAQVVCQTPQSPAKQPSQPQPEVTINVETTSLNIDRQTLAHAEISTQSPQLHLSKSMQQEEGEEWQEGNSKRKERKSEKRKERSPDKNTVNKKIGIELNNRFSNLSNAENEKAEEGVTEDNENQDKWHGDQSNLPQLDGHMETDKLVNDQENP